MMSKLLKETRDIRLFLEEIIDSLEIKTYFSYYGLFSKNIMFGLYKDNKLFLKLPKDFIKKNNISNISNNAICIRDFYFYPKENWKNLSRHEGGLLSLINTLDNENKEIKKLIRNLPNMNINLERLLKRNGINTIDELYKLGPVDAFVQLIKQGADVAEHFLFKLYCALNNQLVYTLDNKEKTNLLREADSALYNAGLRKRFINRY